MSEELQLFNLIDIDYLSLILEGVKIGLIIVISVGFVGAGLNYCLKLFTKL